MVQNRYNPNQLYIVIVVRDGTQSDLVVKNCTIKPNVCDDFIRVEGSSYFFFGETFHYSAGSFSNFCVAYSVNPDLHFNCGPNYTPTQVNIWGTGLRMDSSFPDVPETDSQFCVAIDSNADALLYCTNITTNDLSTDLTEGNLSGSHYFSLVNGASSLHFFDGLWNSYFPSFNLWSPLNSDSSSGTLGAAIEVIPLGNSHVLLGEAPGNLTLLDESTGNKTTLSFPKESTFSSQPPVVLRYPSPENAGIFGFLGHESSNITFLEFGVASPFTTTFEYTTESVPGPQQTRLSLFFTNPNDTNTIA